MANQASGLWADPVRVERLKQLYDDGYSGSIIASVLYAEFKDYFTRNAVIGKASRLGLVSKNQPGFSTREQKPKKPKQAGTVKRIIGNRAERVAVYHEMIRLADVVPLHIDLLDLDSSQCHYPYGDGPNYTFCGCPVAEGLYCGPHYALTREKDPTRPQMAEAA